MEEKFVFLSPDGTANEVPLRDDAHYAPAVGDKIKYDGVMYVCTSVVYDWDADEIRWVLEVA